MAYSLDGRQFTGPEVEGVIQTMLDTLDTDATEHAQAQLDAAEAEAAWRRDVAQISITQNWKNESSRAQYAQYHTAEKYETFQKAVANARGVAMTCRIHMAQLEALRSILSSARAAEHGK